jgi:hypothetical protein
MPQRWRPANLLPLLLLAACGGGDPPLATIEPIRGSTTHEGREIVPLDSAHRRTAEGNTAGEIVPIRGARARSDSTPLREIHPITAPHGPADTLLGTTWNGEGLDGTITFDFLADGILRYSTADSSYTNGTWQQSGNTISFEMNARFAEWTGRIDAARMAGSAHNSAGRRWNWQATRR